MPGEKIAIHFLSNEISLSECTSHCRSFPAVHLGRYLSQKPGKKNPVSFNYQAGQGGGGCEKLHGLYLECDS